MKIQSMSISVDELIKKLPAMNIRQAWQLIPNYKGKERLRLVQAFQEHKDWYNFMSNGETRYEQRSDR